jgi:hypothetical protein
MTPDEIRKLRPRATGSRNQYPAYQESDYRDFQLELLREIALQLAEFNGYYRSVNQPRENEHGSK